MQSTEIESRDVLEQEEKRIVEKFEGKDVARPEFWGKFFHH